VIEGLGRRNKVSEGEKVPHLSKRKAARLGVPGRERALGIQELRKKT